MTGLRTDLTKQEIVDNASNLANQDSLHKPQHMIDCPPCFYANSAITVIQLVVFIWQVSVNGWPEKALVKRSCPGTSLPNPFTES